MTLEINRINGWDRVNATAFEFLEPIYIGLSINRGRFPRDSESSARIITRSDIISSRG